MGLSDFHTGPLPGYAFPLALAFLATPLDLPGSSADLSTRAVPNHPGRSSECICLLLPRWYCPGFILLGGLATFSLLTRPNRVYVMLRLTCSPPKFRRPQYRDPRSVRLHVEQAITWRTPSSSQDQPGLS